jgi:hypothetical protein
MSYTVQKWDNNTAEIAYKLYAFDTDFIIEKEVLTGTSTESTYYNSNVSRETMAAAWTARASKTYDYILKDNLVDNRFNRNFLAFEDSYSCSLFESARKGINIKVEDYPLLWIEGNGGSGYYDSYKGDTFLIEGSGNGCIYGGSGIDYSGVTNIDLSEKTLTTNFTNKLLKKFVNLVNLDVKSNDISIVDVTSNVLLEQLDVSMNDNLTELNLLNNINLEVLSANYCNIDIIDFSNNIKITGISINYGITTSVNLANCVLLDYFSAVENNLSSLDTSDNVLLTELGVFLNPNLASIDASTNILLERLVAFQCNLTSLNISNCTVLTFLQVSANALSSIDFTDNVLLNNINADSNSLTSFDATSLVNLVTLFARNNQITNFDFTNCTLLTTVRISNNRVNAANNSQMLIDINNLGQSNGIYQASIFGGGSLTTAGAAAKAALQGKGWTVTGL